jgi:tetratricopeptide (TPR) repeat protein
VKVVFATLAEFAKVEADGRFTVTGGDIHEVKVGARYTFAVAVRLQFSSEDLGSDRIIEITSTSPDGTPIARSYSLVVRGVPTVGDSRPLNFPFVYTMEEIAIEHVGVHNVSITSGGSLLGIVSFDAIGTAGLPSDVEEPLWAPSMRRSYEAWETGDLESTVRALKQVIAEFPDLAEAYNNVGFVHLIQGQVNEALSELNRAVELDFDRPEIALANLGVCYYMLGQPDEAYTRFKYCLTRLSFIDGAWLLGLDMRGTFLQSLSTAIDYVDLITLNSAWAAHQRGDEGEARRSLRRAEVSSLREAGAEFAQSVQNLSLRLSPS